MKVFEFLAGVVLRAIRIIFAPFEAIFHGLLRIFEGGFLLTKSLLILLAFAIITGILGLEIVFETSYLGEALRAFFPFLGERYIGTTPPLAFIPENVLGDVRYVPVSTALGFFIASAAIAASFFFIHNLLSSSKNIIVLIITAISLSVLFVFEGYGLLLATVHIEERNFGMAYPWLTASIVLGSRLIIGLLLHKIPFQKLGGSFWNNFLNGTKAIIMAIPMIVIETLQRWQFLISGTAILLFVYFVFATSLVIADITPKYYVILLDISGSMSKRKAEAFKMAVAILEKDKGSNVDLLPFDVDVREPIRITAGNRNAVHKHLLKLKGSRDTNIVKAWHMAALLLKQSASPVKLVIFISDGIHDPFGKGFMTLTGEEEAIFGEIRKNCQGVHGRFLSPSVTDYWVQLFKRHKIAFDFRFNSEEVDELLKPPLKNAPIF